MPTPFVIPAVVASNSAAMQNAAIGLSLWMATMMLLMVPYVVAMFMALEMESWQKAKKVSTAITALYVLIGVCLVFVFAPMDFPDEDKPSVQEQAESETNCQECKESQQ